MKCLNPYPRSSFLKCTLLPGVGVAAGNKELDGQPAQRYRNREITFKYPAGFRVFVEKQGAIIRVVPRTSSAYGEESIAIRKLKKNAECDVPQDNSPDPERNRQIDDQLAYAYRSGAALRE